MAWRPPYLSSDLRRVVDIPSRRQLRSAATGRLDVHSARLKTVGDRAFSVADRGYGTAYLMTSSTVSRSRFSVGSLKLTYLELISSSYFLVARVPSVASRFIT